MENLQEYTSDSESDKEDVVDTSKLKPLNLFGSNFKKERIDLHQPLVVDLREHDNNGDARDASNDNDMNNKTGGEAEQEITEEQTPNMVQFNTNEFYQENSVNQDKYKKQLESNEPLKQISNSSTRLHQLSNIIKLGQSNDAKLKTLHDGNRVHKRPRTKNK